MNIKFPIQVTRKVFDSYMKYLQECRYEVREDVFLRPSGDGTKQGEHVTYWAERCPMYDNITPAGEKMVVYNGNDKRTLYFLNVRIPDRQGFPVSPEMTELIKWRDSLAIDSWGEGLSLEIQEKLNRCPEERVPEHLRAAFKEFKAMTEDEQYDAVFYILGE